MDRIGPGALLAGRYRLVERVQADPVASVWSCQDVTLERSAAARILAPGHAHVDETLDAARRAAVVDDPRLQRVLGVGVESGSGYVIMEWIDGPSAADLAGKVGEGEARRLVAEAAAALETARRRGLRHGRLTLGHVRRTADGKVRVTGLAVEAAAIGLPYTTGPDTTDVADLVVVLYALVSGHHPRGFVEGLLGAPHLNGAPVPLRDLRPETSFDLDEVCVRTFAGQGPATAGELAELLAARPEAAQRGELFRVAVVGDPLPSARPVAPAGGATADLPVADLPAVPVVATPQGSVDVLDDPIDDAIDDPIDDPIGDVGDVGDVDDDDVPEVFPGAVVPPADPVGPLAVDLRPFDPPSSLAQGSVTLPPQAGPGRVIEVPEPVLVAVAGGARPADVRAPHGTPDEAPRLVASPEEQEWAVASDPDDGWSLLPVAAEGPEDPVWQARRARAVATSSYARPEFAQEDLGPGWDEPVDRPARRGLIGGALVVGVVALLAVGAVWALSQVRGIGGDAQSAASAIASDPPPPPPTTPAAPPPPPQPVLAVAVQPLDPAGDGENDEDAPRAIDGDPATGWRTERYDTQNLGGLKEGVGLILTLGDGATTTGASIIAPGVGGTLEVRAAQQPALAGSTVLATATPTDAGALTLTWEPTTTPYLVLWFTSLPQVEGEWRGVVSEVSLS